jgi:RimJ/RimL family protein N-acetyltransferase
MPRAAQGEEWQAVRDLRLRALTDAPTAFERTLAEATEWTDDDWMQRFVPTDERVTFVEERGDGKLVGMASGFFDPDTHVVYLGGMFVEPANRGVGMGRGLVQAVESWARELGAARVELEVNPDLEAAVRLYERCGYERTGRRRVLSSAPSLTAIEMSKVLG